MRVAGRAFAWKNPAVPHRAHIDANDDWAALWGAILYSGIGLMIDSALSRLFLKH